MKLPHLVEIFAGLAWVAVSLLATPDATAQTVISNESLMTTTFVVNKQAATVQCEKTGCRAKTPMFAPIAVTCPAATGQTCTFHISLDTKTSISFRCGQQGCFGAGPIGFYQFLVDGAAPTMGPTDENGNYLFAKNVFTYSDDGGGDSFVSRQSYPASVMTTVTNSNSNSHTIIVNFGCSDANKVGGCEATAHWTTMRVDVFEP